MCQEDSVYRRALWNAARRLEVTGDGCPNRGLYNPNVCAEIEDEEVCVKCWHTFLLEEARNGREANRQDAEG